MRFVPTAVLHAVLVSAIDPGLAERDTRHDFCRGVRAAVQVLKQPASATAFCASYLGVSQSTTTSTVINPTPTSTATVTSATESITTTSYVTTCPASSPTAARMLFERGSKQRHQPKPICFGSFQPGKPLSSACNCLSITPSTSTITTTVGSATTTTTYTTATATETALADPSCCPDHSFCSQRFGCGSVQTKDASGGGVVDQMQIDGSLPICAAASPCNRRANNAGR